MILQDLVIYNAQNTPEALALQGPDRNMTYIDLHTTANRMSRALEEQGARPGDRIGIWLEKSTAAVVAMQAILRLNAAYVPLDPLSPPARIAMIAQDCKLSVLITTTQRREILRNATTLPENLSILSLRGIGDGNWWEDLKNYSDAELPTKETNEGTLAYILYTSGSTGTPKGVCISHRNALAFIHWAVKELQASTIDRFANHAPFHFDLSVLDLYCAFAVGASVLLIPEGIAYLPQRLIDFISEKRPTIWYSVPSVLTLMLDQGGLFDISTPSLRTIVFAGEPFPIKHLRRLYEHWPMLNYYNLYGPTETNVCTFYKVTELKSHATKPVPIGRACSEDQVWAQKDNGEIAQIGEEGELMVTGPTVMLGYWGKNPQGERPYATGDLVRLQPDGNYMYIGRRDHMVKIRGYRVELGDIEAALAEHPAIYEAAVEVEGEGLEARLVAYIAGRHSTLPSLLEIKRHCAERLPRYMIVDTLRQLPALPRTRNGKIDRQMLVSRYQQEK